MALMQGKKTPESGSSGLLAPRDINNPAIAAKRAPPGLDTTRGMTHLVKAALKNNGTKADKEASRPLRVSGSGGAVMAPP